MAKKSKTDTRRAGDLSGVDLAEIEQLLVFMEKHGLEEFEYQRAGVHVRLKKASGYAPQPSRAIAAYEPAAVAAPAHPPAAPATPSEPARAPAAHAAPSADADLHIVKSPIVGTFYAAPSPDAGPFVSVGDRVDSGQVLCIIEAMKLMNEIESDVAGEVVKVFVENGHPVEYGESLFGIRQKSKK